jgi:fructose/tagatose bisphosphate aldolase
MRAEFLAFSWLGMWVCHLVGTGKTFRSEYNTKEDFTMPLVSMTEMLKKANAEGYAVGQFNLNNLEFTQAILQAAQEEKSPVILGVSEGAARYMGGFKTVVAMVKALMEEYKVTVPVAIHLILCKSDSRWIYICYDRCFSSSI